MERLQKVMAEAGVASRRRCEELIREGEVRVNGKVVRACTTLAEGDMLVEPCSDDARIRDLMVQLPPLTQ